MKLQTEIIALCDYATISQEGKLSINGIFDEVRVRSFPGGIARAFLVTTIKGAPNTPYNLTLKVESETVSESPLKPLQINVQTSPNSKSNIVIELVNVVFKEPGNYQFVIYHKNEKIGFTILKVFHVQQHATQPKKPN